ncbi:unnamed protein product [Clonostachys byssicola]|uniref:Rhodopsin domain-containing protein n=1 Tax=Clonostachys byssicola TaxID=160290 RepID=A0A9N9UU81_9HYPO|nr:unnamed protein product [Clonostachys byssicola]
MSSPAVGQDGMSLDTFLAVGCTLVVLSALFVAVRVWSDFRFANKLFVDDYFAVAAIILLAACFAMFHTSLIAYSDPLQMMTKMREISQYGVAVAFLSGFSMFFAKAPVLLLLMRIFGVEKWLRWTCVVTLVVLFIATVAGDAYNAHKCNPPAVPPMEFILSCADASALVGVILGPIGLAADIVIFILPIPVIVKLHMPLARKIGLGLVFLSGIFAITASAVALYYKFQSRSGTATDIGLGMTLTTIESTMVIIAGCAPALRAFWGGFIIETRLYGKLSSFLSSRSRTRTGGSSSVKRSKQSQDALGDETTLRNTYVTLEDHHSTKRSMGSNIDHSMEVPLDSFDRRK